ncbi:uncharacterized protein LOC116614836 isoform X2 [Nematostella vectensis]|uniref:uncharacterized protein LOC116614836 isoform X2 n=1 Tax=Nematostella vectensis TaxID=45351 RepID=UPI00207779DD|nr:uncharacterized protein LOC116614836 isoform X2 [Nematostella vectensis]
MSKEVPESLKQFIRALLLSAKNGVKQTRFISEYKTYTGESSLNFQELGYQSLYEFLLAIPDVARVNYSPKHCENLVFGVAQKDVYASDHAKKASKKSTGLPPRPPSQWEKKENNTTNSKKSGAKGGKTSNSLVNSQRSVNISTKSLKVTVDCSSGIQISPNAKGWYGVLISNLPEPFTEEDIKGLFSKFGTLKEAKIVQLETSRKFAFAKYSEHDAAVSALLEMDGYVIRGSQLRLKPATQKQAPQTTAQPSSLFNTSKANMQKVVKELKKVEISGIQSSNSNDPKCFTVIVRFAKPIKGITEVELYQIFSAHGSATKIEKYDSYAILGFDTVENVIGVLQHKPYFYNKILLTVEPWTESSAPISPQSPRQDQATGFSSLGTTVAQPTVPTRSDVKEILLTDKARKNSNSSSSSFGDAGYISGNGSRDSNPALNTVTPSHQGLPGNQIPETSYVIQNEDVEAKVLLTVDEMDIMLKTSGQKGFRTFENFPNEINVLVTEIVDSCHFWVIVSDGSGNWDKLEKLREELQRIEVKPGQADKYCLGAAKFSDDNLWYRCFVLDMSPDRQRAKVLYADYGNSEWVSVQDFTLLDKSFWSLPPQALPVRLAGLEPACPPGKNLSDGGVELSRLICNKACMARKHKNTTLNLPHILEVDIFVDGQCINTLMESRGFAQGVKISKSMFKRTNMTQISITWVYGIEKFLYQEVSEPAKRELEQINKELKAIPLTEQLFPQVGSLACLLLPGGERARVKIVGLQGGFHNGMMFPVIQADVLLIDLGCMKKVHVNKLLRINNSLASYQAQVRYGTLAGLKHFPEEPGRRQGMEALIKHRFKTLEASVVNWFPDICELEVFDSDGSSINLEIAELLRSHRENSITSQTSLVSNGLDKLSDRTTERRFSQSSAGSDWEKPGPTSGPMALPSISQSETSNQTRVHDVTEPIIVTGSPLQAGSDFYMPPPPMDSPAMASQGMAVAQKQPLDNTTKGGISRGQPTLTVPARTSVATHQQPRPHTQPSAQSRSYGLPPQQPGSHPVFGTTSEQRGLPPQQPASHPVFGTTSEKRGLPPQQPASHPVFGTTSEQPILPPQQPASHPVFGTTSEQPILPPQQPASHPVFGTTSEQRQGGGGRGSPRGSPQPLENIYHRKPGQSIRGFQPTGVSQTAQPISRGSVGSGLPPRNVNMGSPTTTIGHSDQHVSRPYSEKIPQAPQQAIESSRPTQNTGTPSRLDQNPDSLNPKYYNAAPLPVTAVRQGLPACSSAINREAEWKNERELLVKRLDEQRTRIFVLQEDISRQSDLEVLKAKLEKQVRITTIENEVLKLRKEIEQLEASKASLQLTLMK